VEASNSSVCYPSNPAPTLANTQVVSGGFAIVQPNSSLSINAVEGYPLEDFSADAVRSQIAEAQKIAGGSGSEQDIAEAKIELEVRCAECGMCRA
jgi:F0F1-type ATP synthase epsilon subunit